MKILIAIPIIKNAIVAREAINQVINKDGVEVLLLDNGADEDVKQMLKEYENTKNVIIFTNPVNEYVTQAWNSFMWHFLENDYDKLIICNSDLSLQDNWDKVIRNIWLQDEDLILTPVITNNKEVIFNPINTEVERLEFVTNPAGVFITLSKEQAKIVYPIPAEIKIWFNDTWIYSLLNAHGYKIAIPSNLVAFHHTSTSVSTVQGIHAIIEEDKIAWRDIVEPMLQDKIKQIKK